MQVWSLSLWLFSVQQLGQSRSDLIFWISWWCCFIFCLISFLFFQRITWFPVRVANWLLCWVADAWGHAWLLKTADTPVVCSLTLLGWGFRLLLRHVMSKRHFQSIRLPPLVPNELSSPKKHGVDHYDFTLDSKVDKLTFKPRKLLVWPSPTLNLSLDSLLLRYLRNLILTILIGGSRGVRPLLALIIDFWVTNSQIRQRIVLAQHVREYGYVLDLLSLLRPWSQWLLVLKFPPLAIIRSLLLRFIFVRQVENEVFLFGLRFLWLEFKLLMEHFGAVVFWILTVFYRVLSFLVCLLIHNCQSLSRRRSGLLFFEVALLVKLAGLHFLFLDQVLWPDCYSVTPWLYIVPVEDLLQLSVF